MEKVINKFLPVAMLLMVAVYSVWPMVKCLGCVADYGRDGFLINWIINTSGQNLYGLHWGSTTSIFNGNIFYPYQHVLAYSELFFVTAMWAYPVGKWIQNPAIVSGLALVVGQLLTLLVIYKWWKKLSGNRWGAVIAAIAFGLSQIRFEYQVHLQMWSMQWWLIGTWLVCTWLADEKKQNWKFFSGTALLGLQVWESLLPIYFAILIIAAGYGRYKIKIRDKIKEILIAGAIFATIASAPLLTYWGVGKEFNYQRSIRDAANNSLAVNDIWGEFASPGLYILFVIAIWQLRNSFGNKSVKWLSLVFVASLVIALGPVLKWGSKTVKIGGKVPIPLPYAVLYYTVPGFGALRTPSRWIWVSGWAASGLVAMGIGNLRLKTCDWRNKAAIIGMLLLVIISGKSIKNVRSLPGPKEVPEAFKWLGKQSGDVLVILPMTQEEWEMERLPYIFTHNKKTLNGFSGFYPFPLLTLGKELTSHFPDEKTVKELKDLKVNWVVVDNKMYNEKCKISNEDCGRAEEIQRWENAVWEDRDYAVYKL